APAAALFSAALLALGPVMSERPWLFTILFSTLLLEVLLDLRDGRPTRRHWLLPLMFVLWANLHVQFIYGLLILGVACAAPLADRLLRCASPTHTIAHAGSKAWWALVALTCLCSLATLINPYHAQLYQVVFEYGTHQTPLEVVNELR